MGIVKNMNAYTDRLNGSITKNSLFRGILLISGGTVISQIIGILTMLIIAHIYTPVDFGILAVYSSVLSIVALISSLRYELAIPLPKEDVKAANLLTLCFVLTVAMGLFIAIIVTFYSGLIISFMDIQQLSPFLWLIIIGFMGLNVYQILNYWAIRKRDYARITYTKLNQTIAGSLSKIVLGILSFGTYGLLVGDIISKISGIGTFITILVKQDLKSFKEVNIKGIVVVAKEYYKFPLYSFSASILNTIALQLPFIIIPLFYGLQEAGYYSLAFSVLGIPASLIGGSISQAFFGEIALLIRENPQKLESTYKNTTFKLLLISIPIILTISIISPYVFPIIFGEKWIKAGSYCLPLVLLLISSMTISPTSYLEVYGFNGWVLIWDLVRTVLVLCGFYVGHMCNLSSTEMIVVYGIIMTVMYIVCYFMNIMAIRKLVEKSKSSVQSSLLSS